MLRKTLLTGAIAIAATAAGAQTQRSAVRANNQAAAAIDARQDADQADARGRYAGDLAAYDRALARHDARTDRRAARYRHQQRAYADAMAAWRSQVYACRHGSRRACNAPTPDPAAFY